jgi:hypothetical protein
MGAPPSPVMSRAPSKMVAPPEDGCAPAIAAVAMSDKDRMVVRMGDSLGRIFNY